MSRMSHMKRPNLPELRERMAERVADGELRWTRHVPSGLTLAGLCCGATAIKSTSRLEPLLR